MAGNQYAVIRHYAAVGDLHVHFIIIIVSSLTNVTILCEQKQGRTQEFKEIL